MLLGALAIALASASPGLAVSVAPGWPQITGDWVWSSPALGDLDGDGDLEVVVGCDDSKIYAWHHNGSAVTGWPQAITGEMVDSSPALGDLDGDGLPEVVIGSFDGKVYVWSGTGALLTGWPQSTADQISSSPALGDIDGDGDLEVVVGSRDAKVYAWHHDGTPVDGWPQATGAWVWASPALGDIDGDGDLEIVAGSDDAHVYAWHGDGSPVAGWPQATGDWVDASPALGDLDGDGQLDVVAGCFDTYVYAWHGDGTLITGWPQLTGDWVWSSPALGDLDGDGDLEVVVGCDDYKVYAWHHNGSAVSGWPKTTGDWVDSSPALADLDGDGHLEVVVGSYDTYVHAWHDDGTVVTGWPVPVGNWVWTSPAVADVDGDGDVEVVVGSYQRVHVWSADTATADATPWPMFRHDARRTGRHGATPVGVPMLSSGYVTPTIGDADTEFTYRVKYWNTANQMPDRVLVAIWSSTGTVWRQMGQYDPSDTDCVDGKWYTYSCHLGAGSHAYRFGAQVQGAWIYWPEPAGTYLSGPTMGTPEPPILSSGYVTPASGTHGTQFTWRIKYWQTDNLLPDEVWCAVWWGSRGKAYWYRTWALDPSDTNTKDGKWYTLSMRWLDTSAHAYRFAARQGSNWAYWPKPAGSYQSGPSVTP